MRSIWVRLLILTLALVAAVPALAAEGRTPVFLDGTVIGVDGRYILTRSIFGGGGTPVIDIAAPNVDLDLNGFSIFQIGGGPPAILISAPPVEVKIHNGMIVGGTSSIERPPGFPPGRTVVIEDIQSKDAGADAFSLFEIDTVVIRRNTIIDAAGTAISLPVSVGPPFVFKHGEISNNAIKRTRFGPGIMVDHAAALEIAHNQIEIVGAGGGPSGVVPAIHLIEAVGCLVKENVISDPDGVGILLEASKGNKLYNNVVRHAFSHCYLLDPVSEDNLILNNVGTDCGFDVPPGNGLFVEGLRNHIHGNTFNANESCGMLFGPGAAFNTFGRNMARGNGAGGGCGFVCPLLFPPDSCDLGGPANDTSLENMIPFLF